MEYTGEYSYYRNMFQNDEYITVPDRKICLGDKIFLKTRWWLYYLLFKSIWKCAEEAKIKPLSQERFMHYGLRVIYTLEECGGIFNISGINNIGAVEGPLVFIGNHMSLLETLILPGIILSRHNTNITFVVKKALSSYPVFKHIMSGISAITIGRDNPREDLKIILQKGKEWIEKGKSIVIFPQSTRSPVFSETQFNSIGVKLAKTAKVKIIPFALKTDFMKNGIIFKDFGSFNRKKILFFKFGKPLTVEGNGKETHRLIIEFIKDNLIRWGGEVCQNV